MTNQNRNRNITIFYMAKYTFFTTSLDNNYYCVFTTYIKYLKISEIYDKHGELLEDKKVLVIKSKDLSDYTNREVFDIVYEIAENPLYQDVVSKFEKDVDYELELDHVFGFNYFNDTKWTSIIISPLMYRVVQNKLLVKALEDVVDSGTIVINKFGIKSIEKSDLFVRVFKIKSNVEVFKSPQTEALTKNLFLN